MKEQTIKALLDWYLENKRMLPWRESKNPYYIWISEIMLQQTRIEAVKEYFVRFISQIPNISALAAVDEEKLLKLWEGLGYYNRARNLKRAAIQIMEEYEGVMPKSGRQLLALPGIGHYTAGAIASIAYNEPEPAVDGNVLRVFKRLDGSYDDIIRQKVKTELEERIRNIIPKDRPGDFNEAVMELGEVICIPNGRPFCEKCPIQKECVAYRENRMLEIPVKPTKKSRKIQEKTVLLLEYQKKIAIRKRKKTGLLSGMWEYPNMDGAWKKEEIKQYLIENHYGIDSIVEIAPAKHVFSHVEWHMLAYKVQLNRVPADEQQWVTWQQLEDSFPLPTAFSYFR